jgi:hypothetical protein
VHRLLWIPTKDTPPEEGIAVRAFGTTREDLEVDFDVAPDRTVTEILCHCAGEEAAIVDGWTVKKRRQGLIAVAVATNGGERRAYARCGNPNCAEELEFELDLNSLRADWRKETITVELGDAVSLTLRPPVPADLAVWANKSEVDASSAGDLIVSRQGNLPDGWNRRAAAALEADDPLADATLEAACPACGDLVSVPLTVELHLIDELARTASLLMDEVHFLASAYHWSESDILGLPRQRRQHYLARAAEAWAE